MAELDWTTFGIGGILAWYLYYTTSTLIPGLNDKHTKSIETVVDKFTAELSKQRESTARELEAFRETSARDGRCLLSADQLYKLRPNNSDGK